MFRQSIGLIALFFVSVVPLMAQTIQMEFPAFAGKTYDFVIFQGSKTETIIQDTIPKGGKFSLAIPPQYAPYTGMCRWLITGTAEGGGLDMAIQGKDYAVACVAAQPNESNIVFTGYDAVNELNRLNREQQSIVSKYEMMVQAERLYAGHHLQPTFVAEKQKQQAAYRVFREQLKDNSHYAAKFLPIVSLVRGIAPQLSDDADEKARQVARYISEELDFNLLYTSGHWSAIIGSWVQIQATVIKNDSTLVADFKKMSERITSPKHYTDFVSRLTHYLSLYGKDAQINLLVPYVVSSGKITEYQGNLAVYQKAVIGTQAPDLVLNSKVLKCSELTKAEYQQTLLVFYLSDCGHCEALMQELGSKYNDLKAKGVRVITISGDEKEELFKKTAQPYPWSDKYCDYKGFAGSNFKNYGVQGTPTLILISQEGKVLLRTADIETITDFMKQSEKAEGG